MKIFKDVTGTTSRFLSWQETAQSSPSHYPKGTGLLQHLTRHQKPSYKVRNCQRYLTISSVSSVTPEESARPMCLSFNRSISDSRSLAYCSTRSRTRISLLTLDLASSSRFWSCMHTKHHQACFYFKANSSCVDFERKEQQMTISLEAVTELSWLLTVTQGDWQAVHDEWVSVEGPKLLTHSHCCFGTTSTMQGVPCPTNTLTHEVNAQPLE